MLHSLVTLSTDLTGTSGDGSGFRTGVATGFDTGVGLYAGVDAGVGLYAGVDADVGLYAGVDAGVGLYAGVDGCAGVCAPLCADDGAVFSLDSSRVLGIFGRTGFTNSSNCSVYCAAFLRFVFSRVFLRHSRPASCNGYSDT